MKLFLNLRKIALFSIAAAGLSACVVTPSGVEVNQPPIPYYVAPSNGYVWMLHPKKGWGWQHPHYGWHHKKESRRHRKHH